MAERPLLPECEPFTAGGGTHGALVLHGLTGCPQPLRPLAQAFAGAGLSVELPLLPGHGTRVEDMMTTTWDDWSGAVESAYAKLAAACDRVVVAGLSMGGALSLWLASRHPEIAGVVCVNPVIRIADELNTLFRQMIADGEDRIPAIAGDLADPEAHEAGYGETPLAQILSLSEGLDRLRPELAKITSPLLLMNSPQDHVVPPANSDELAGAVGGPVERISLERSYHVATVDYDRDLVCAEATAFAQRCLVP